MAIKLIQTRSQVKFSPTETKIVEILSDGKRHLLTDILKQTGIKNRTTFRAYLFNIRKKIEPFREEIICQVYYHKFYYRYMCALSDQQTLKIRETIAEQKRLKEKKRKH